jgi:GNAT acetyltransferase-like protein
MLVAPIHTEIDKIDRNGWTRLIMQFDDATLYQTWSYGAVTKGARNVSHAVLRVGDEILGCCQVTVRRLPLFDTGIADIKWGPLWRRKGKLLEPDVFLQLIKELKKEYAINRRYLLRIWPGATGEHKQLLRSIFESERLSHCPAAGAYRTLCLDLSPCLDDLRKNFLQKWRNCLNKAERSGLTVVEGTSDGLYNTFLTLAQEMTERKKFTPGVDYGEYHCIQKDLPELIKMRIAVCEVHNRPICAAICSAIGDTGVYVLGATGDSGMGLNGAYLLQWHIIQRLKETGVRCYDLGGIDPRGNPGVYGFKVGIAGKSGKEEELLGEFHGCFARRAEVAKQVLNGAKFLRRQVRAMGIMKGRRPIPGKWPLRGL